MHCFRSTLLLLYIGLEYLYAIILIETIPPVVQPFTFLMHCTKSKTQFNEKGQEDQTVIRSHEQTNKGKKESVEKGEHRRLWGCSSNSRSRTEHVSHPSITCLMSLNFISHKPQQSKLHLEANRRCGTGWNACGMPELQCINACHVDMLCQNRRQIGTVWCRPRRGRRVVSRGRRRLV